MCQYLPHCHTAHCLTGPPVDRLQVRGPPAGMARHPGRCSVLEQQNVGVHQAALALLLPVRLLLLTQAGQRGCCSRWQGREGSDQQSSPAQGQVIGSCLLVQQYLVSTVHSQRASFATAHLRRRPPRPLLPARPQPQPPPLPGTAGCPGCCGTAAAGPRCCCCAPRPPAALLLAEEVRSGWQRRLPPQLACSSTGTGGVLRMPNRLVSLESSPQHQRLLCSTTSAGATQHTQNTQNTQAAPGGTVNWHRCSRTAPGPPAHRVTKPAGTPATTAPGGCTSQQAPAPPVWLDLTRPPQRRQAAAEADLHTQYKQHQVATSASTPAACAPPVWLDLAGPPQCRQAAAEGHLHAEHLLQPAGLVGQADAPGGLGLARQHHQAGALCVLLWGARSQLCWWHSETGGQEVRRQGGSCVGGTARQACERCRVTAAPQWQGVTSGAR